MQQSTQQLTARVFAISSHSMWGLKSSLHRVLSGLDFLPACFGDPDLHCIYGTRRSSSMKRARRQSLDAKFSSKDVPALPSNVRMLCAKGRLGEVHFLLQRVAGGLYVEREEIPRHGLRTVQSVHFVEPAAFNRWCDGDPVRFEHPLLHVKLKRDGDDLWRIDAQPADG